MTNNFIEEKKKEFEKKFIMDHGEHGKTLILLADLSELTVFLESALTEMLSEIKTEVEGMAFVDSSQAGQFSMHVDGYNQAIEEVTDFLTNLSNLKTKK